jgi:hypothetical protein
MLPEFLWWRSEIAAKFIWDFDLIFFFGDI